MIALTRRYRFPAAHVLRRPEWSDEENARLYGKCANPGGHGHDYGVEVTVTGRPDPRTGRVADPAELDAVFAERVAARFGHRLLNDDPAFAERVPTAEHLAETIRAELAEPIARRAGARLLRVRIVETRKNSFTWGEPE